MKKSILYEIDNDIQNICLIGFEWIKVVGFFKNMN